MARTAASTRAAASTRTASSPQAVVGTDTQPSHTSAGTLFEDFQTGWSLGSGSTGAATQNSATQFKTGTGSLKLASASGAPCFADKTINQSLASVNNMGFWVYVDSPYGDAKPTLQMTVVFFWVVDGSNYLTSDTVNMSLQPGWQFVVLGRGDFTATGTATWDSTFTSLRARVNAVAAQVITVYFDSLYFNVQARPLCVIQFDDNWDSAYTEGYTYMAALGLVGTLATVSSFLGQSNRMTAANVETCYAAGWDVINHTDTHPNMTAYTEAQALAEWQACETSMQANGWTRRGCNKHAAYPHGGYGTGVIAANTSAGILTSNSTIGMPSLPPMVDSAYHITARVVVGGSDTGTSLLTFLDRAIQARAGVRLVFHRITAGAPSVETELSRADFRTFMDGLAVRNGNTCDVVTWTEAYGQMIGSRRPAR